MYDKQKQIFIAKHTNRILACTRIYFIAISMRAVRGIIEGKVLLTEITEVNQNINEILVGNLIVNGFSLAKM